MVVTLTWASPIAFLSFSFSARTVSSPWAPSVQSTGMSSCHIEDVQSMVTTTVSFSSEATVQRDAHCVWYTILERAVC